MLEKKSSDNVRFSLPPLTRGGTGLAEVKADPVGSEVTDDPLALLWLQAQQSSTCSTKRKQRAETNLEVRSVEHHTGKSVDSHHLKAQTQGA